VRALAILNAWLFLTGSTVSESVELEGVFILATSALCCALNRSTQHFILSRKDGVLIWLKDIAVGSPRQRRRNSGIGGSALSR